MRDVAGHGTTQIQIHTKSEGVKQPTICQIMTSVFVAQDIVRLETGTWWDAQCFLVHLFHCETKGVLTVTCVEEGGGICESDNHLEWICSTIPTDL